MKLILLIHGSVREILLVTLWLIKNYDLQANHMTLSQEQLDKPKSKKQSIDDK